ncbi:MAG: hypothetical protein RMK57_07830 [Bryobacterales bacterium]|nr:hypothetical protein [Bryobacteraceae bacterium]MDW8354425.1 hypothetical protein [Bryobacterales bacterium]
MSKMLRRLSTFWLVVPVAPLCAEPDYDRIAARVAAALRLQAGERVLVRFDPSYFAPLEAALRARIREAGAVCVATLPAFEPMAPKWLEALDVFIRLPLTPSARPLSEAEEEALRRWGAAGGARRELHLHWSDGTRRVDGLPAEHTAELDRLYQDALDIDYAALDAAQERAIQILRRGTVRVRTPAGTDFMFRIARRPFNKQNGDASPERARAARIPVDRHIELPAGALRVAPVEESAFGQIVLPEARFGDTLARNVVILVDNGRVSGVRAQEGLEAVQAALEAGGEAARRFREFALGFNPKLAVPVGSPVVPYYGYGAGVVRLSLGDNQELGGAVRGRFVRWFFLTDATVHVDFRYLVRDGKLEIGP